METILVPVPHLCVPTSVGTLGFAERGLAAAMTFVIDQNYLAITAIVTVSLLFSVTLSHTHVFSLGFCGVTL